MAGLYFAVLFVCVHILTCAPVHNGETQNEKPNKLLNNTLAVTNETVTSCQSKLREAFIEMANYKRQKMDLQTWMSRISQAIVDQQQLMTKLHIDIDSFLGWAHSANGTLQFSLINESIVSNETDGTEDIDLWDEDFWPRRRAGWLTQQKTMTEGQIMPESPSEAKPGVVEPLEVVDYEEEGGLSVQENENTAKEVTDNEQDPGETVVSKEITEAPRKTDVTETPNTAKAHTATETMPGTQQPKQTVPHHKTEKEPNESPDPLEPPEQEETEQKNQAETENEPPETENEQLETENEPQEKENEPQEKENEPLETENEAQENEKNQQEQVEKESETEQQGEERQQEALHFDEGPHKDTGRYAHSKLGRKLLGLETAETSNSKAEGHDAESKSESSQVVHDLRKRVDACLSIVTQQEGFNKLHGMERYTEQNSVSQSLKVLECVLDVIKGVPVARQNIFMSRLQRFLETMEHWGQ